MRNRPTSIHHWTEWAISKFNDHFSSALKDARMFLESDLNNTNLSFGQVASLIKLLDWISQNQEEITIKSCLRYAITEFHQYFYTDIDNLAKAADSKSSAPTPIKFDLSTDETDSEKSHFAYVFSYAWLLYNAAVEEEIKEKDENAKLKKHDRNEAKQMVQEILEEPEISKLLSSEEDEEEMIYTTKDNDEYDLAKYANLVDHLSQLRASVKHQLSLDKDDETMLCFVHSATWIRAENFSIPHDHVTLEMTHLACGKIIPALSTTTGIIVGFLMNELLKISMGLKENKNYFEYNINLSSPSISCNILSDCIKKQCNSILTYKTHFKAPKSEVLSQIPNPYINTIHPTSMYWDSWFKHTLPDELVGYDATQNYSITVKDMVEFVDRVYGVKPIALQIYPNFKLLRYVQGNQRYENPVIDEFKGIIRKNQEFCIVYIVTDEKVDDKAVQLPPIKLRIQN